MYIYIYIPLVSILNGTINHHGTRSHLAVRTVAKISCVGPREKTKTGRCSRRSRWIPKRKRKKRRSNHQ